MNKSLIFKHILSFGAGIILASLFMVRTPTIEEKTKEVRSAEDISLIESLQKELQSERFTTSVLKRDVEHYMQASSNIEKDIEEVTTITKPDGTKIITEKKDKTKTTSQSSTKDSQKTETLVVEKIVEKEVVKYIKQEDTNKTSYTKETEFKFNPSISLGLGVGFNFEHGSFNYNFLSSYQFSPMFGIYSSINLSAPYVNRVESIIFGFTLNF